MRLKRALITALLGLSAQAADAAPNVTNGGFEQPGTFVGPLIAIGAGSSYLSGWKIETGSIILIQSHWKADEAMYSVALSSLSPAKMSQTISGLKVGQRYALSFAMAGNSDGSNSVKPLTVSAGDISGKFTFDTDGASEPDMAWQDKVLVFVAVSDKVVISFESGEGDPYGPVLDNIAVSPAPKFVPASNTFVFGPGGEDDDLLGPPEDDVGLTPVPLPAPGLLLIGALGGLGVVRSRRKA
jgi:choice-of-anchor C domain-containing protein